MKSKKSHVLVIAHRGVQELAPENTLASFQKAIELGVDGVEFDVLQTNDGHLIVHHDYKLGRTNNGKGFIWEHTLEQIRLLDAGSWFDQRFEGELIPTFEEAVDLCKGKCHMEIELKDPTQSVLDKCLKILHKEKILSEIEITSPHIPVLNYIKKKEPKIRIGMFIDIYPDWMSKKLGRKLVVDNLILSGIDVAHIPIDILDRELVEKLHQKNKLAHAADCNTKRDIKKALVLGVDQISTNKPGLALKIINAKLD